MCMNAESIHGIAILTGNASGTGYKRSIGQVAGTIAQKCHLPAGNGLGNGGTGTPPGKGVWGGVTERNTPSPASAQSRAQRAPESPGERPDG